MNPERVLEDQAERNALLQALRRFATSVTMEQGRQGTLAAAGLDLDISYGPTALLFATSLVARFAGRAVSLRSPDGHPLRLLLAFFLAGTPAEYGFTDEDVALFERLVSDVDYRRQALSVRRAVARVENERGQGIGTGLLVAPGLFLTCLHIFDKSQVARAWVRFGYKTGFDGTSPLPAARYELDLADPVSAGGGMSPDYVLLPVERAPETWPVRPVSKVISAGQRVRLIHHPMGQPAVISEPGCVTQAGADYVLHDVATEEGSSGAPIFDSVWEVIALHRGYSNRSTTSTTEGIPIYSIWDALQPHL